MSDFTPIPEPEIPVYPEHVKMIMPGEPASGGYGSPENTQAEQLVQRTAWLNQKIQLLQQSIPGTEEFQELVDAIKRELDRLSQISIGAVQYQVDHLERIVTDIMLQLELNDIYPDSDGNVVESFRPPYQIDLTKVKVLSAVKNDDSVDVENVSQMIIGANYIISDGIVQEAVQVKNVITSGDVSRIITTSALTQEYDLNKTYIYRSTCEIRDGKAIVGGQSKSSRWEPGLSWTGEEILGGAVSDSINFGVDEKAGFDVTPGVAFVSGAVRLANIIGVVDTGTRSANGAGLALIDENFNIISSLDQNFFNNHPLYNFPSVLAGTNYFRKVPIAYWKRGRVPTGKTYDGNWYMLLCDVPADGFAANGAVYKKNGVWQDGFLYGTYRAFNDSNKPGSQPGKTNWGNVSWQSFRDSALGIGDGHHMLSMQEYHEVLGRAVIEKCTFQLWNESERVNHMTYRGIEDIAYGPTSGVYAEWRDGIRVNSSGYWEIFADDGSSNYVNTNISATSASGNFITKLREGGAFDFMFVVETVGAESSSMIPDYQYVAAPYIPYVNFHSGNTSYGAFNSYWGGSPSGASGVVGGRLAKL
ncbi:MAG: hypothetical protein LBO21_02720 [Synergistaceae bacterium]|jgi:hypothetical protein|nr:hypothetical protein [Synergistaceae bacterium]